MHNNRRRGIILIVVSLVIVILLILLSVFIFKGVQEKDLIQRQKDTYEAFNLAEAGLDRAVTELKNDFNWAGITATALGRGEYSLTITSLSLTEREADCFGYIPSAASPSRTTHIKALIRKAIPANFYKNAVYSAGDVDFNGNSFSVANNEAPPDNKAVIYADEYDVQNPENITGTSTQDANISPLARLDFTQLRAMSVAQGNLYDAARLQDVQQGSDTFPAAFWSAQGTDGIDNDSDNFIDEADERVNIVYIEGDLQLNGNIGSIGGFFVVAGDVLTDPSGGADATINGNGSISGCIYTLGEFTVNGGGGNLNVDGGIWAQDEVGINGNASVTYNASYMNAISGLSINPDVQVVAWQEV
ncbi:MAG: hypothetical protein AABY43_06070 [Candidatus Omnitrophota bacterium]